MAFADPLCLVMVESLAAIADLPLTLALDGVDGVYVGPRDLSLALGCERQVPWGRRPPRPPGRGQVGDGRQGLDHDQAQRVGERHGPAHSTCSEGVASPTSTPRNRPRRSPGLAATAGRLPSAAGPWRSPTRLGHASSPWRPSPTCLDLALDGVRHGPARGPVADRRVAAGPGDRRRPVPRSRRWGR